MLKLHSLILGALQTNCYIWEDIDTKNAIVIDAPDDASEILEFAENKKLNISDIILTHGHFDHILALYELKEKTGARLSASSKTQRFLSDMVLNLCHYVASEIPPVTVDNVLNDGDVFDFFGNKVTVIETPGHTEDSICLLWENILISGDTLFKMSVGRWDHPTGDMKTEMNSIKTRLLCLDDNTEVYPGHGEPTTIGEERRGNPYIQ